MTEEQKNRVQTQFGRSAELYVTSKSHAEGASLDILHYLIRPRAEWVTLDVATGAGHTALMLARHVKQVTAVDITPQMLATAARLAAERGLQNITTQLADAEQLPFADESFDLVTCRIAFHHFGRQQQALNEMARVLKVGGILGFTDTFGIDDPELNKIYNRYEQLRDPSHVWSHSMLELVGMVQATGLKVECVQQFGKEFEFEDWTNRQKVSAEDKLTLLEMMRTVPEQLREFFQPRWEDGTMYFTLREVVITARKMGPDMGYHSIGVN